MFRTVELPLWLLVLILAFAAVTAMSHFLLPSVRWFFRRRMERVVARLNERLPRPIEPFKLLRRQDMIQRLVYDAKVMEAVAEHAHQTGVREDVAFQEAQGYAREIVPAFSATAYFGFAIRVAKLIARAFYRVQVGTFHEEASAAIGSEATVVFVMNHRSNMDYVLVTYLVGERSALSYAVGEWAHVWPLAPLIRAMGGYFIRRKSRNPLYRRVLARYVQMATRAGVVQAIFPEGGLSRTGATAAPKLGLLSYILSDFDPEKGRDVVFVPVGLSYDRVIEDRMLVSAAAQPDRMMRPRWQDTARYFLRNLGQRLRGRFVRFGYAGVCFGPPLSLRAFLAEGHAEVAEDLGRELMARISRSVPVLPLPLVADCLLEAARPLSLPELVEKARDRVRRLEAEGVTVIGLSADLEGEIATAVAHLRMRNLVRGPETAIEPVSEHLPVVRYYAASAIDPVRPAESRLPDPQQSPGPA